MPARDPEDQAAAREFEQMLRYYVFSGRSPQSKLDWFLGLPKRVRRSRRLIGEALGPYQEAQEQAREEMERLRARELERDLHLAALRAMPRDLSCLKRGNTAWQAIGRRKKRCRAYHAIGKAFARHHGLVVPPREPLAPVPIMSLEHQVPTRPTTPAGLREAVYNTTGLFAIANGHSGYGLNTSDYEQPGTPTTPAPKYSPPEYPTQPEPGELTVFGQDVDPDYAYIVAVGRHYLAPWQGYSLRDAAVDIIVTEEAVPGALGRLADLLCPEGVGQYEYMLERLETLVDFCRGWYALSY